MDGFAHGGMVKLLYMQRDFPHTVAPCNLLYLVSSALPYDLPLLLAWKKSKGVPLVLNQNGVAYPGWHGPGFERTNRPLARALAEAAHVFYQSKFCKEGADHYLGSARGTWEVLHNPVDTRHFVPAGREPDFAPLRLLLGGTQYQYYRFETALQTLACLLTRGVDARLLVTGSLGWGRNPKAARAQGLTLQHRLGLDGRVDYLGTYSQADAPRVLGQGDILLHTKYNDPCPGVVLEAMACGLPVAYSASGGLPELVGPDAGVGVPAPASYEKDYPPDPGDLAEAVQTLAADLPRYQTAARQRAVEHFDLASWLERHRQVFMELLA